ncbi:MAG TPA: VOC family protein [Brevundimonas sp.]|uniref:VOC family protein n=1 Tax=Brevundimonas sp. TaxID=1871086 RepID=UPI00262E75D0|nr:VOC family protein [Brevundimonas sp.]HRO32717.1 VOC family protein [Brevundimonas sp.]
MADPHSVPAGGVIPYLTIPSRGGQAAVEFYRAAFGAEELFRNLAEDGERIMHSRLMINGALVMLSDEFPEYGMPADVRPQAVTLHLQVDDADEWWARALVAGAVPTMPLADQFWGDRYGRLTDPFGHSWSIGAPVRKD